MTAVDWPAWMPEPPAHIAYIHVGAHAIQILEGAERPALLAWYNAAKAADPDFCYIHVPRPVRPSDPETFEARKRDAFPLPEDTAPPGWLRTPGQAGGDDLILERDDRVRPLRFPDGTEGD